MNDDFRVMLVDDDLELCEALADSFDIAGIQVEVLHDGHAALHALSADYPGIVITDIRMPRADGHRVLEDILNQDPDLPVILMTGHGDIEMAVTALRRGAFDFIAKPFSTDHLIATARRALETRRLTLENRRLRAAAQGAPDGSFIGESPVMRRLKDTIRQLASVPVDVLIEGETGTGKDLTANLLHRWSARSNRPFVAVDCAALPESVAEEVLFGSRVQRGRIAEADRGTLFLDEVDSLSFPLQGRLLRVVEERVLPAVAGGGPARKIDLRIIAAAKDGLTSAVQEGRFRADLLYRLESVRLRLPPLRERREDIALLFAWFAAEAAKSFDRPAPPIDAAIQARLQSHDWPGNVRELRNFATQSALGLRPKETGTHPDQSLTDQLDRFELELLTAALRRFGGDVNAVSEALSVPRRSLYARLQRLGLEAAKFRSEGA